MIPLKRDPRWRALVEGKLHFEPSFLALKLLLQRVQLRYQLNSKNADLNELIDELHSFFVKYESFMKEDIQKLFK